MQQADTQNNTHNSQDNSQIDINENNKLIETQTEPKKRGRKAIIKVVDGNENNGEINNEEELKIKRRGRKSNTKIINITEKSNTEVITNLIAHLPLKMSDILKITNQNESSDLAQKENMLGDKIQTQQTQHIQQTQQPKQQISKFIDLNYDVFDGNIKYKSSTCTTCTNCKTYENKISELNEEINKLKDGLLECSISFNKKIYESEVKFCNKNGNEWPEKTDIACWWCCHQFDHIPLGIPEYINKKTFYLSGCYCSFNCMMAYNIDQNDYKLYDRQSNIYQLKNQIDPQGQMTIHPAGPRQTLKLFGGPFTIIEYRHNFFILNRECRYFMPPMVSIIGIIEEDSRDITGKIKMLKNDTQMLRRKKPLPRHANNLNALVSKI